jgi:hypothetical protein
LMMAGLFWEKSIAGWWLISQTNRAFDDVIRERNNFLWSWHGRT